jgi:tetratricopeptide (TPR) repeat protein
MQAFEEALEEPAITNESYALNGLAEVYLRQGHDPARALELLDMALEKKPTFFLYRLLRADDMTGQIIANRAWALAQQRRHLEAEQVLDEAFQKVDRKSKPRLAAVHYRAGHVLQLRGNKQAAREHARTAQELDPHGDAGRLAAQAFR